MNTTVVSEDRSSFALRSASLLRSIVWISLVFAAIKVALHIITNIIAQHQGYGIFRDEVYYLICGQRLAFGYVDQPPMVAVAARVTETLFGHDHMWSLRLIPALAGGAKVFLTGMLAWALGGGRRAVALAMLGVLIAGVYLGIDSFLSMNCFDPVFWMTCTLALIMIVQAERPEAVRNWWILLGVSAGLGLENKVSEVFFLVCVLVALLLTPQRRILKSKWFGVAVLLLVWVSGVVWLLVSRAARPFRFLGVVYLLFLALMMAMHAKDYYLAPVYPVFFAAGGVAGFSWAREQAWKNALIGVYALALIWVGYRSISFSIPVMPPERFVAYEKKMGFAPQDTENHDATILPQFYADRFGWSDLVAQVNAIYHALPPNEQAVTGIFAGNYGQASAINLFGPKYGLPQAISGHQSYWIWGPQGYTGQEMILITGATFDEVKKSYASCSIAGVRNNPLAMPWEHGNIYLCYGRNKTYAAHWNDFKHYY